jgi:hypothetical protein
MGSEWELPRVDVYAPGSGMGDGDDAGSVEVAGPPSGNQSQLFQSACRGSSGAPLSETAKQ